MFREEDAGLVAHAARRVEHVDRADVRRLYGLIYEGHPLPMLVFDARSLEIIEANDAAATTYGFTRDELRSMSILDIRPSDEHARVRGAIAELSTKGVSRARGGWRHQRKDGTIFDVEVTTSQLTGVGPHAWLAMIYDVSEKRSTERALRASEALHRRIVETASEGIVMIGLDGRLTFANRMLGQLFREEPDALVGRSVFEFVPPENAPFMRAALVRRSEGVSERYELTFVRRDGTKLAAQVSSSPIFDEDGQYQGSLGMLTDLTAEKHAEECRCQLETELRQSQKLEAIGRLAGSVAHDFNNMLSVVMSSAELLERDLSTSDPRREEVEAIRAAGTKAATLTRQLLTFSKKSPTTLRPLDLNGVLHGILPLARRALTEQIVLETSLAEGLPPVRGDVGQLEQVIMNLVVNARDAISCCGRVTVKTERRTVPPEGDRRCQCCDGADCVVLTIRDTGSGMTPEVRAHIFEPFFTTKAPGKGTGLGLATVYGIVQRAHGNIVVESEVGLGTTFEIWLPAAPGAADLVRPPSARAARTSGNGEHILIVEDDGAVGAVSKRVLQSAGYEVRVARSPADARELASTDEPIDLLLLDVVLPTQFGTDLALELADRHPHAALLFMSGYTDERTKGVVPGQVEVLAKPFTRDTLEQAVKRALAGRAPRGLARSPQAVSPGLRR